MSTPKSQCVTEIDFDNLENDRRHNFDLVVSDQNGSKDACVPVSVIVGGAPGKRLTLIAGVHGDEAEGVATLFDLTEELDPAQVVGQVVIVPIANPGAFTAGLRRDPVDDVDLNRTFPGDAHGTVTERLAHALFDKLVRHADFVLSMHGWSATGATLPYVEYAGWESKTAAHSLAAAASAGFDLIWDCPWPAGMMMEVLVRAGVPGLEAEIGGLGTTTREGRERYRRHIVELMRHLGIHDHKTVSEAPRAPRIVGAQDILATNYGLLVCDVTIGDRLEAGSPLATIRDRHGREIERLTSPIEGFVGAMRCAATVNKGDHVFRIFFDVPGRSGDAHTT